MKYKSVLCGGTFDRLHNGHKAFLEFAFSQAEHVTIGLTTQEYILQFKKGDVLSFEQRKKTLEEFFKENNFFDRATILPINDVYGPALRTEYNFDAIVATDDTLEGAQRVNEKREENHLPALPILTISLIKNNEGKVYSSSAVREEESKEYRLPSFLRAELQKPFGLVIHSFPSEVSGERMVTVGDITTKLANKEQKKQWLSVIDFTVERKPFFTDIHELNFDGSEEVHTLVNSAATITSEIWNVLKSIESTKRHIVLVTGEEDLLVLPLIIFLPLGMNIFYGQPGQGMVWVVVSEETKQKAKALLAQFS